MRRSVARLKRGASECRIRTSAHADDTPSPISRPYSTPTTPACRASTKYSAGPVVSTVWNRLSAMNFQGWNVTRSTSLPNMTSSVNGSVAAPITRYLR